MRKNLIILLLFFSYFISYGQSHQGSVSGTITDSDGLVISGATVVLKGPTNGTVSDMNGFYFLKNVNASDLSKYQGTGYHRP